MHCINPTIAIYPLIADFVMFISQYLFFFCQIELLFFLFLAYLWICPFRLLIQEKAIVINDLKEKGEIRVRIVGGERCV